MKHIKLSLLASALGVFSLGMTSCSTTDGQEANASNELTVGSVSVEQSVQSKSAVEGSSLPTGSQYGLTVVNANTNVAIAQNKQMESSAVNTGINIDSDVKVYAYYPYSADAKFDGSNWLEVKAGYTDYLVTNGKENSYSTTNTKMRLNFRHALSRVKFVFSTDDDASYSVRTEVLSEVYTKALADMAGTVTEPTETGSIGMSAELKVTETSSLAMETFVVPQNLQDLTPSLPVYINGTSQDIGAKIADATEGMSWQAGYMYTYNINIHDNGEITISSTAIEGWGTSSDLGTATGEKVAHEYVDLGLTSGTLWATTNIGANVPEGEGLYFAWGDTNGYPSDGSHSFVLENYVYYNGTTYTKYLEDNKSTLEAVDDAASVNWGSEWSMPTETQAQELIDETTMDNTEINGMPVIKFTSKKDATKFIYIPMPGGYMTGTTLWKEQGYNVGQYWCNTIGEKSYIQFLDIYNKGGDANGYVSKYIYPYERAEGRTIRPVHVK